MSYKQPKRKGYWIEKIIDGKKFRGRGPIYCPAGTRWADLKEEVDDIRKHGHLCRVEKTELKPSDGARKMFGNTHSIWLWVRRKNEKPVRGA